MVDQTQIARTEINNTVVSTLRVDTDRFETMVFAAGDGGVARTYDSEAAARVGHTRTVATIRRTEAA